MNNKKKFSLLIWFVIISFLFAVFSGSLGLSEATLTSFVSSNPSLASLIYLGLFCLLAIISFSLSIITVVGLLFFPMKEVFLYSIIGIMFGASVDFFIARKLGYDYVRNYVTKNGGSVEHIDRLLEKNSFKTIFVLSAIAIVPPKLPNLVGGIMKMTYKDYFISILLGNAITTFFVIYLTNGIINSNNLHIYLSITGLTILSLVCIYFYRKEFKGILMLSFPRLFRNK